MSSLDAVTESTTNTCETFDAKINNWAEGVLLTIDADHSRFTIRGAKRPYASEYAKMLKAIHDKTKHMTHADRLRQSLEVRLAWKGDLEKAHAQEAEKECDMTFQLPGHDGKLVVVDETPYYNRDAKSVTTIAATANLTDKECKAIHALKDLKVGECVVVGYDGGLLRNDAYVVIKANACLSK